MNSTLYIEILNLKLSRLKGFGRIEYLSAEKCRLDESIFNKDSLYGGDYRDKLLSVLGSINPSGHTAELKTLFNDYKTDWGVAKNMYFNSNELTTYEDFLGEFRDFVPGDIADSIERCKSTDFDKLELQDSINIFHEYYLVREWIKNQLSVEFENHQLTDKEAMIIASAEQIKLKWNGSAVELVGLNEVLINKNWITPAGSNREKAIHLLKCFTFQKKESSIQYITKVFKAEGGKTDPFKGIKEHN